jgi:photosystem II stability/assembly factor-like uncharacterized protein
MNKSFLNTIGVLFFGIFIIQEIQAQEIPENVLDNIHYRAIGPTRQGGRYVDFAVVDRSPKVYYAATASGGLWKTVNNGISFFPIFDNEKTISIGDVAVDQNDTSIVWVGTGEANNSRSSYWGDGIYKSTDGGKTWNNMGLKGSQHIGRILIHPENSDILYVAALGPLYSDSAERGLYKTIDGGKTWNKVLSIDGGKTWNKVLSVVENKKHIGVVDAVMHPENPDIIFAASYDKIRTPWTFNEGGPGSRIYMTTDGANSWKMVEGGLPMGFLGRIGLDISLSNPDVMYANIENVNVEGVKDKERLKQLTEGIPLGEDEEVQGDEMYRSEDGGTTWKKISPDGEDIGGGPAYYYQQVRIDPNDENHVYVIGIRMWETTDGGEKWERPFSFGGDNHAMWINPADSKHMLLGYDHGMGVTYDGGEHWYHPDEIPLAQFYAVGYDMDYPYNVYGGLQDNGSQKGPSTKRSGGPIRFEDWKRVGGGDGMYNEVDPNDSRWLYNESQFGPLTRRDQLTGESKSVKYQDKDMRWNWNSPILISPHNSDVIYHAGNKVVPDLTKNDPAKIQGTGNIQYCTITALEESPVQKDVLWVGTDDGNVQISKDGGKNWTLLNDKITGNPGYWISRIEASNHFAGTAYLTYTGYRRDDFRAFIYKTTDFGETWTSIVNNLPAEPINVVREDHKNPNLLFVGTEFAVYASIDGGQSWSKMKGNMPTTPVHDLKIHPRENDLIVGTHGRGIFITDITPLQEMSREMMNKDFHLFKIESKVKWVNPGDNVYAFTNFDGESEKEGIHINYWSKSESDTIIFMVHRGKVLINEVRAPVSAGLNQATWNMSQRVRPRTDKEKKQLEGRLERFRSFGMTDAQIAQWMGAVDMEYITEDAPEGVYKISVKVAGDTIVHETQIMKDHWYK